MYDDGSELIAYPESSKIWRLPNSLPSDPPDTGGGGSTTPVPAGAIYNPWSGYSISGTWADHMSYSLGGIDYPLPYGTNVKAPADGVLQSRNTGGLSDTDTGWVGSAGRRSILRLDAPFPRVAGRALETGENPGDMVAIVFQHQSKMGTDGARFLKGQTLGVSGASADGKDYGGDVHLHVHGLNASGQRVDLLNFIP